MAAMNLEQLHLTLSAARCAADVFGSLGGDQLRMLESLRSAFRGMVQVAHPDHCPSQPSLAGEAMRLLAAWRRDAEEQIRAGTYLHRIPRASAIEIELHSGSYRVHELLRQTELYAVYRCTCRDAGDLLELKVLRRPRDSDLARREVESLKRLSTLDPQARRYFPDLRDAFVWAEGGVRRQALVLAIRTRTYSLAEIRSAYPAGLDLRDAGWMFNRLLEALWFAHQSGLVHGAVLPPSVSVSTADHGLVLGEWAYATEAGQPMPALSGRHEAWYPPEVFSRAPVTPAADIAMAARCLVYLLGGDPLSGQLPAGSPSSVQRMVRSCLLPSPARRPGDAGEIREEFGDVLLGLYGRPAFRVFTMPV